MRAVTVVGEGEEVPLGGHDEVVRDREDDPCGIRLVGGNVLARPPLAGTGRLRKARNDRVVAIVFRELERAGRGTAAVGYREGELRSGVERRVE